MRGWSGASFQFAMGVIFHRERWMRMALWSTGPFEDLGFFKPVFQAALKAWRARPAVSWEESEKSVDPVAITNALKHFLCAHWPFVWDRPKPSENAFRTRLSAIGSPFSGHRAPGFEGLFSR